MVAGEIAAKRKDWDAAILHLDRAVRYEDALIYQEPPDWHAPVRQNLAAVLLAAGRADEAEAVYWEDLRKNPGNGWSLFGLMQALKAQGKVGRGGGHRDAFPQGVEGRRRQPRDREHRDAQLASLRQPQELRACMLRDPRALRRRDPSAG